LGFSRGAQPGQCDCSQRCVDVAVQQQISSHGFPLERAVRSACQ
jgi:hypothetical protein